MDNKIQLIKTNFNKIKEIRMQVINCFNALEIKLTKLKSTTDDFVKNNKHNIFVFGLDSFQFQSKLIDYEYNDMRKFYFALNNRMYCEYYKLYKLILNYTEEIIGTNKNIETLKITNIFPVYKDLEPLKQYDFDTIGEIHKTIITLLHNLNDHILAKENQLQLFKLKQHSGLNINNFVTTFDFDVIVIKQKCLLYISYLEFFHNIHTKHFKRFSKKMKLMNDYLDEDIKFDEAIESDNVSSSLSVDSGEDHSTTSDNQISPSGNQISPSDTKNSSIKSLFKTNTQKIIKSNNISLLVNEVDNDTNKLTDLNINIMLDTLTNSFDTVSDTIPITNNDVIINDDDEKDDETKDDETKDEIIIKDELIIKDEDAKDHETKDEETKDEIIIKDNETKDELIIKDDDAKDEETKDEETKDETVDDETIEDLEDEEKDGKSNADKPKPKRKRNKKKK
jgi:hypothetical protein